jgi:HTH-type transcriptional regulator/antitoxin HigA
MMVVSKPEPLDFTHPHVLRNPAEYERAIAELDELVDRDPQVGSKEYDRLEFLSLLAEAYEAARYPAGEMITPQRVVDFFLEQHGQSRADLARMFGGRSRVSDFFKGKRRLSLAQISALIAAFGIPADLLINRPKPAGKAPGAETGRSAAAVAQKKRASG